jgi:hypothetical protein
MLRRSRAASTCPLLSMSSCFDTNMPFVIYAELLQHALCYLCRAASTPTCPLLSMPSCFNMSFVIKLLIIIVIYAELLQHVLCYLCRAALTCPLLSMPSCFNMPFLLSMPSCFNAPFLLSSGYGYAELLQHALCYLCRAASTCPLLSMHYAHAELRRRTCPVFFVIAVYAELL